MKFIYSLKIKAHWIKAHQIKAHRENNNNNNLANLLGKPTFHPLLFGQDGLVLVKYEPRDNFFQPVAKHCQKYHVQ